jgi:vacuolar-type H+-ATPase subunit C/Vma6
MTTIRDTINDFGRQVSEGTQTKTLDEEKYQELLDLLMDEIKRILERTFDYV